jgi:hypothetical protein
MITLDITEQLNKFNQLHKDMPYLVSRAMNNTAFKDSRGNISLDMNKKLIIRSKNISKKTMFTVTKSHKTNLLVKIKHKIKEIGFQQFGGTEKAKDNFLVIPNRKNIKTYFGIGKNKNLPEEIWASTILKKAPLSRNQKKIYKVNKHKLFIIKKLGVFLRFGNDLKSVFNFVKQAKHTKRQFNLQDSMTESFDRRFTKRFTIEYLKLLKG